MRIPLILVALLASLLPLSSSRAATEMGIMTGGERGTYYQFGLNLQKLAREHDVNLTVHLSKGSIENIYAVYQKPATQMGIVQSDVLAFVARVQSDPVLRRIAKKTKMVLPLYNEEIHILARPGIAEFDDLGDRRVAIGREGSGTYLTARLLFNVADVSPREMVLIDTDEALAELKAGRIDAMFYVAGYPVKLFSEGVSEADGLGLVPILNKSITEFYPRAEIPANTYRWQPNPVPTVAVKSVLISFDFRRRDCDSVGRFAKTITDNLDWLKKNGHPKWNAVDLNFPLKGWEQYDCVRKYLGKPGEASRVTKSVDENPIMDAIKQILGN
ncbi:MAG TPA: TAXI family TRAP transporter solute-binding subunit [Methylomirabilota bacterium]|jgi:TRAP transporter TAXI family solute receptor|nr:TAXI family TRAP transporter solute-binding subunit [Methylomirabilota bacterium]